MRTLFLMLIASCLFACGGNEEYWLNSSEILSDFDGPIVIVERSTTVMGDGHRGMKTVERSLLSKAISPADLEELILECEPVVRCDHFPRDYRIEKIEGALQLTLGQSDKLESGVVAAVTEPALINGNSHICTREEAVDYHPDQPRSFFKVIPADPEYVSRRVFWISSLPADDCVELTVASGEFLIDVVFREGNPLVLVGAGPGSRAMRLDSIRVVDLMTGRSQSIGDAFREGGENLVGRGIRFRSAAGESVVGRFKISQNLESRSISFVDLPIFQDALGPTNEIVQLRN